MSEQEQQKSLPSEIASGEIESKDSTVTSDVFPADTFILIGYPHPFQPECYRAFPAVGTSIADAIGDITAVVYLDGHLVDKEYWHLVKPKEGTKVTVQALPQSGDSGRVLSQIVLTVAVMYVTATFGPWAALAVNLLGTWAINQLFPMEDPDDDRSIDKRPGLTGARNTVKPFEPLPRPLGKIRYMPPMAARPYNTTRGNEQYLNVLLCLGYDPLNVPDPVNNIEIGETRLSQLIADGGAVSWQIGNYDEISLFSDTVTQENLSLSFEDRGDSFIRTTSETKKIGIELVWSAGLHYINDSGRTREAWVYGDIEFRKEGASSWTKVQDVSGASKNGSFITLDYNETERVCTTDIHGSTTCTYEFVANHTFKASASDRKTLRAYFEWPVSDPDAQYEVRVTRKNDGGGKRRNRQSDFSWVRVNSFQDGRPFVKDNVKLLALQVRASDQTNRTLDNVSVYVESEFSTWDGASFSSTSSPTNNPGEIIRGVLTDPYATTIPAPDNKLDDEAFGTLVEYCNEWGLTFNKVLETNSPMVDILKTIAQAGRADPSFLGDVYSVAMDLPDEQPLTLFTPRNASSFTMTKKFSETPDAYRIEFLDENSWEQDERIVYNDGFDSSNAVHYEVIDLTRSGITNPDHVWQEGRYRLAQSIFRSENYSLQCGVENLRLERGRAVRVAWDTVAIGLSFGRTVKIVRDGSNNVVQIQLDEPALMEPGKEYALEVRNQASDAVVIPIDNSEFEVYTVDVETPQDYDIDPGDLFIFGERGLTAVDAKIKSVRRSDTSEIRAEIDLVPSAPEIYDALSDEIPPYEPTITVQGDVTQLKPPKPIITSVRSDDSVIRFGNGGEPILRIGVFFEFPADVGNGSVYVEARWRQQVSLDDEDEGTFPEDDEPTYNEWTYSQPVDPDSGAFFISEDVEEGDIFQLQLRSVSAWQQRSEWTSLIDHQVVGQQVPPNDVTGFGYQQRKFGTYLFWTPNPEPDIERYEIRLGSLWPEAETLQTTDATNWDWEFREAGLYRVWIAAINYAGLRSDPVSIEVEIDAPSPVDNIAYTFDGRFVNFTWNEPEAQFSIEKYRIGYEDGQDTVFLGESKTTTTSIDGTWVGPRELFVEAIDIAGNIGERRSVTADLPAPDDVEGAVFSLEKFGVRLQWDEVTNREIKHYEIRLGDEFTTSVIIQRTNATRWDWELRTVGTYTTWVRAVDVFGNRSANPTRIDVEVVGPSSIQNLESDFDGPDIVLSWERPESAFGIEEYEIRYDDRGIEDYLTAQIKGYAKTTTFSSKAGWIGERSWWVTPIDVAGNPEIGTASQEVSTRISVNIEPPNTVRALTVRSFDNNALLLWEEPEPSTLPVTAYEVRKGPVFEDASKVGTFDGTFANLFELQSGEYVYWVVAIDAAGNRGEARSIKAFIADPPDFIFRFDDELDLEAADSRHIYFSEGTGYLPRLNGPAKFDIDLYSEGAEYGFDVATRGPFEEGILSLFSEGSEYTFELVYQEQGFDFGYRSATYESPQVRSFEAESTDSESYGRHWSEREEVVLEPTEVLSDGSAYALEYLSEGTVYEAESKTSYWSNFQHIIDAGYPYWLQPTYTDTPAYWEKEVDYGTVVETSTIRLFVSEGLIDGDVNAVPTISYKEKEEDDWITPAPGQGQITGDNFQFVKYRLDFNPADDSSLMTLDGVRAVLDSKNLRDSGSAISAILSEAVLFDKEQQQYAKAQLGSNLLQHSTIEAWLRTDNLIEDGDQWGRNRTLFAIESDKADFQVDYGFFREELIFTWHTFDQALGSGIDRSVAIPVEDIEGLEWGTWIHFAAVLSDSSQGNTFEVYLEGQNVVSTTADGFAEHGASTIYLAGKDTDPYMDLRYNEVRIWPGQRSGAQILDNAERIIDPDPTLTHWWRFLEAQGTAVADSAGSADLALINSPDWRAGRGDKVSFNEDFTDIRSITLSANEEAQLNTVYKFVRRPNPEYFRFSVYDTTTNQRVSGVQVGWAANGV